MNSSKLADVSFRQVCVCHVIEGMLIKISLGQSHFGSNPCVFAVSDKCYGSWHHWLYCWVSSQFDRITNLAIIYGVGMQIFYDWSYYTIGMCPKMTYLVVVLLWEGHHRSSYLNFFRGIHVIEVFIKSRCISRISLMVHLCTKVSP